MHDDVEVTVRDPFSEHGEELVRSRYAPEVREQWGQWPQTAVSIDDFRDKEVLVAKVRGVVAGRAILDALCYPFAELENLEVLPAFRGRGLASRIVADGAKRAASMGFLAVHIQSELDNVAAHRVYAKHGFLPATQGEMLKLVRFLNYAALFHFLWEYPLALYECHRVEGSGLPVWQLSWVNPIGGEKLGIRLLGGSCQADSAGFGPAVSSFLHSSNGLHLETDIRGPRAVSRGQTFDIELEIANRGLTGASGACRLVLHPGLRPPNGTRGAARFSLEANSTQTLSLPVEVLDSFDDEVLGICAYRSVSVVVEVFAGDTSFWLSHAIKISREEGG